MGCFARKCGGDMKSFPRKVISSKTGAGKKREEKFEIIWMPRIQ